MRAELSPIELSLVMMGAVILKSEILIGFWCVANVYEKHWEPHHSIDACWFRALYTLIYRICDLPTREKIEKKNDRIASTISWNSAASGTNQIDDDFFVFSYWNFPFHLPKYINTFGWKPLIRHTVRIRIFSSITCTKTNDYTLYSIVFSATIFRVISSQFHLLHISKTYFGFLPVNLFDSCVFCL